MKRILLLILSCCIGISCITFSAFQSVKANNIPEPPVVTGIPTKWTNEPVQLTVKEKDDDLLYSFSTDREHYNWQQSNVSQPIGNPGIYYVTVMDDNGVISQTNTISLRTVDMMEPELNVSYQTTDDGVIVSAIATDDNSGVLQYSFDGGQSWSECNNISIKDSKQIEVQVKDKAGNTKIYETMYYVDVESNEPSVISIKNTLDKEGNLFNEITIDNHSGDYEYNFQEEKWSDDSSVLVPFKQEQEVQVSSRMKSSKNTRASNTVNENIVTTSAYPVVAGPAVLVERGKFRLVGQGYYQGNTDIPLDSPNGSYQYGGYTYQAKYKIGNGPWTVYTGPVSIRPSQYGQTLYAKLTGPNESYITEYTLATEEYSELVPYTEVSQSIGDKLLTVNQMDYLINANYDLIYRYTFYPENSDNVLVRRSENMIRLSVYDTETENQCGKYVTVVATQKNGDRYIMTDMEGNEAIYDPQQYTLEYTDKKKKMTHYYSQSNLYQIKNDKNQVLYIYEDNSKIRDFNNRFYNINGNKYIMPSGNYYENGLYVDSDVVCSDISLTEHIDYTYDDFQNNRVITSKTYLNGKTVNYTYFIEDDYYTVVTEESDGKVMTYKYDLNFNLVSESDECENLNTYIHNDDGNVSKKTTEGIFHTYNYNEDGQISESKSGLEINPNDAEAIGEFTYDDSGQLIKQQLGTDNPTEYTYDTNGNITEISTTSSEDEIGDLSHIKYDYDSFGNVIVEFDLNANTKTNYTYNEFNDMLSKTVTNMNNNESYTVTYTYDLDGNKLSEVNEEFTNTYEYNQIGKVILECVDGNITRTIYNSKGKELQIITSKDYLESEDGLKQTPKTDTYSNQNKGVLNTYGDNGALLNVRNEYGVETEYIYDGEGNISKDYPDIYSTVYTTNGQVERYRVNGYTKILYTYDTKGNVTKRTYPNSQNIQYLYSDSTNASNENNNINSLLLGIKYKNDTANRYTFAYDEYGTMTEKVDVKSNLKTTYVGDNIAIKDTLNNAVIYEKNIDDSYTTQNIYNATYTISSNDDIFTISKNQQTVANVSEIKGIDGEVNARQSSILHNGSTLTLNSTYQYVNNQVSNITLSGVENTTKQMQYSYDNKGNISRAWSDYYDKSFSYDANNQLIKVVDAKSNRTNVVSYDSRGNITSEKEYFTSAYNSQGTNATVLRSNTYVYDNDLWEDQLTSFNGKEITYDDAGNRLSFDGWNYTWTGGRLLEGMTNSNYTLTFKYDDKGYRTEKKVGNKTIRYILDDGVIVGQSDGTNTLYFYYDENGDVFGFECNGVPYAYMKNVENDVIGIVDVNGNIVVKYYYDAWGNVEDIEGSYNLIMLNPFCYRSYYYDIETGLYYLQSRYYDPVTRRFINADEFEYLGKSKALTSYNLYVYADNNPIMNSDESGHASKMIAVGISVNVETPWGGYGLDIVFFTTNRIKIDTHSGSNGVLYVNRPYGRAIGNMFKAGLEEFGYNLLNKYISVSDPRTGFDPYNLGFSVGIYVLFATNDIKKASHLEGISNGWSWDLGKFFYFGSGDNSTFTSGFGYNYTLKKYLKFKTKWDWENSCSVSTLVHKKRAIYGNKKNKIRYELRV